MAIYINYGVLGSGKTVKAVKDLLEDFCELHVIQNLGKTKKQWYVKKDIDTVIISNIEGLDIIGVITLKEFALKHEELIQHFHLQEGGKKPIAKGDLRNLQRGLFNRPLQQKIGLKIYWLIDEAQEFLRKGDREVASYVKFFFENCRHEGHDVMLITQHYNKLMMDIQVLPEVLTRAVARSDTVGNQFVYESHLQGSKDIQRTVSFKANPDIFRVYKSAKRKESKVIKNYKFRKMVIWFLITLTALIIMWTWMGTRIMTRQRKATGQLESAKIEKTLTQENLEEWEEGDSPWKDEEKNQEVKTKTTVNEEGEIKIKDTQTQKKKKAIKKEDDRIKREKDLCMVRMRCWNGYCYVGRLKIKRTGGMYNLIELDELYSGLIISKTTVKEMDPPEVCYPLPARRIKTQIPPEIIKPKFKYIMGRRVLDTN